MGNKKGFSRIATNSLVLFARMLLLTFVNLYTVRLVLRGLGAEDYGIFNAVAGVVTASSCVSSVLALSTQRFYSYAMGRGETERLREIFSASINICLVVMLGLFLLLETAGTWFVTTHLTLPPHRLEAALWVFHFSLFSFVATLLQIPFLGAVFAHEDMGYYAIVSAADCLVKLLIAYSIGMAGGDHLACYGGALMGESFLVLVLYVCIARKHYAECRYAIVRKKGLYRKLFSFSGWSFYGALAGVGMTQGSSTLLNMFFGPITNAAFGVASQIYYAINTLAGSVSVAFRPAMTKAYSAGDGEYLERLFFTGSKAILYLLAMVAIPLIFEARTILTLWLGYCTPDMVNFARLYTVYTVCLALHNPITTVIQATGHIRNYSIYVESITILCVPVNWCLFRLGMPSWWLFVTMTGLCALAHVVRLLMLRAACPSLTLGRYAVRLALPGTAVIGATSLLVYGVETLEANRLMRLALAFAVSATSISVLLYAVGISKNDRRLVRGWLNNRKMK